MATKTVHRYRIDARIEGEIPYDPAKPETYTAALDAVATKREALADIGAKITHDRSGPITVRE